ncbi:transcriptional regulator [Streptomyces albus]|uniref:transcriptional regulator n=1 Tax=Streptomyces albus TaxID=1888 RepID=UPI0036F66D3A
MPCATPAPAHAPSMLHRLAAEHATGAYTRAGGTLFLVEGRIVHAESPAAPGLEALLSCGTGPHRGGGRGPHMRTGCDSGSAGHPATAGTGPRVPGGVLELCASVALHDAAFFVLAPGGGPGRFRRGVRPWPHVTGCVTASALEREAVRRRTFLDRIWPDGRLDALPPVPARSVSPADRAAGPPAPVPGRRRAVLELADGVRTASDIARELRRPAFHTLVDVRRLAAAGLLVPASPPPVRAGPARAQPVPGEFPDPDVSLLRRLRDALEAW